MKVLIVQLRRIGDILLTTPVIAHLKKSYPGTSVHFLTEPMGRQVLETNPNVDRVWVYDRKRPWEMIQHVRAEHYDAVLDFMNNPRTAVLTLLSGARWRVGWRHGFRRVFYNMTVPVPKEPEYVPVRKLRMLRAWMDAAGLKSGEPHTIRPELVLAPNDEAIAQKWMRSENVKDGEFVVLAPAHRHPIRSWRKDGFHNVGIKIAGKYQKRVYLAWGPGEESWMTDVRRGAENVIGLLPMTTMREMAAIFKHAALVVTNDSGAMHTAVAVGTPTVTIYGPTRPIDWNPSLAGQGPDDIALNASELDCLGCHLDSCPIGHLCMKNLPDERVLAACEKILG